MLAASELATNAIAHTASGQPGGLFAVHLTLASPDHIAVLVTDQGGPSHPRISHPGTGQASGRGLKVVASLASLLVYVRRHHHAQRSGSNPRRTRMTDDSAIDRASIKHAYQQVADIIAGRIAVGYYHRKLSSERGLADDLGVSYTTVRHAMAILRQQGLVVSIHGRGTFIASQMAGHSI